MCTRKVASERDTETKNPRIGHDTETRKWSTLSSMYPSCGAAAVSASKPGRDSTPTTHTGSRNVFLHERFIAAGYGSSRDALRSMYTQQHRGLAQEAASEAYKSRSEIGRDEATDGTIRFGFSVLLRWWSICGAPFPPKKAAQLPAREQRYDLGHKTLAATPLHMSGEGTGGVCTLARN